MIEKKLEDYDKIFDFIQRKFPDWERLLQNGSIKIKTNQPTVQFADMEQILQKFNLRITSVSYTDYYGIIFGIEKLETN